MNKRLRLVLDRILANLMLILTIVTAFALLFLRKTSGTIKDTQQHAVLE